MFVWNFRHAVNTLNRNALANGVVNDCLNIATSLLHHPVCSPR